MSNQGNNNNFGGFFKHLKVLIEIGGVPLFFVAALISLIKFALSDTQLVTKVFIIFSVVIFLLLCRYVYFHWEPRKIWRPVALVSMFAIFSLLYKPFISCSENRLRYKNLRAFMFKNLSVYFIVSI
jgi:hypothetical protein